MNNLNIKRTLIIIVLVLSLFSAAAGSFIYASFNNYHHAVDKERGSTQILNTTLERRLIGDDYLLNPGDRARLQWQSLHDSMRRLLNQDLNKHRVADEQALIGQIQTSLDESQTIFDDLVSNTEHEQSVTKIGSVASQKSYYATALTVSAQKTIAAALKLQNINQTKAEQQLNRITLLFSLVGIIYLLGLLGCFYVIWRIGANLQERTAQDEALLKSIGDGVFAVDSSGRIILFNQAAEKISGLTHAAVIGQPYDQVMKFINPSNGSAADHFVRLAMSGQLAQMDKDTVLQRPDGTLLPVADSASPLVVEGGHVAGAIIVFRDISIEYQVEKAKDEFVSLASHQLRTPATGVKTFLGLLKEGYGGQLTTEQQNMVNKAYASNERQLGIIEDLLNVSRLESGRMKFNLQPLDIGALINDIAETFHPQATARHLELNITPPAEPIEVSADDTKLRMALENLIDNAIKYTEAGSVTIKTEAAPVWCEIRISDTGMGIDDQEKSKLFHKFSRLSNAAHKDSTGSGLGLYLVKRIIEGHGGSIEVESTLGKGTTFIVKLPKGEK